MSRPAGAPRESRTLAGMRLALGHAAWAAPLLAPLGLLQGLLVLAPWLDSLEAAQQDVVATRVTDWVWRTRLETVLAVAGGLPGATLMACLALLGWLVILRTRGPLRGRLPWSLRGTTHRVHALRLGAALCGVLACLLVQQAASRLDRVADAVTGLRPTGGGSLTLVLGSQVAGMAALSAIAGATLALARLADVPRKRRGALLVLTALGLGVAASFHGVAAGVLRRFDVGLPFERVVGNGEVPRDVVLLVMAQDRRWHVPMRDGLAGTRFTEEAAVLAEDLLRRRDGWSVLAPDAERFVIGERLLALDPEAARERALECLLRAGRPPTAHALLVALGSAAPSAATRRIVLAVATSSDLHLGPQAMLLLARAHAQAGEREHAQALLARLRAGDEAPLIARRAAVPIILRRFTEGRVTGRILLDGRPFEGRVGLVSTQDLFSLPAADLLARDEGAVRETWLLRLAAATDAAADGSFEMRGLPEGEMALVLLLPGRDAFAPGAPLPRLLVGPNAPVADAGEIALWRDGIGSRSPPAEAAEEPGN